MVVLVATPVGRSSSHSFPVFAWKAIVVRQAPRASTADGLVCAAMPRPRSCGVPAASSVHRCRFDPWNATENVGGGGGSGGSSARAGLAAKATVNPAATAIAPSSLLFVSVLMGHSLLSGLTPG